jgi:hypothetical protein
MPSQALVPAAPSHHWELMVIILTPFAARV